MRHSERLFSSDFMRAHRFVVILLFAAVICAHAVAAEPPLVSGIWQKGHNITEPRPKSSKFMKVTDGGFLVIPSAAAYRLHIEISPSLETPYFMQAVLENPADRTKPFVEEAVISQRQEGLTVAHGPVKGLRISGDYRIVVKIFRRRGDAEPIDTLEQKIRSYVDTTGPAIKMKGGMKSQ